VKVTRITDATLIQERKFETQRFYPGDRVRLRLALGREKGTVIRSNQKEDGGTQVEWDQRPGKITLHNPRYMENVWLNDEGEEE